MNITNKMPVKKRKRFKKVLFWISCSFIFLVVTVFISFKVSPWPSALVMRYYFNKGGVTLSRALALHVPGGVSSTLNVHYLPGDKDAYLDVYYPTAIKNTSTLLPVIVWVHGGGWLSGSKQQVANYCKILAAKGYTIVAVDYSLAPGHTYPTPVCQVNDALGYIKTNAQVFHADAVAFILGGDSGGAQIAAQLANIICVPSYAQGVGIQPSIQPERLKGIILFCGAYDIGLINLNGPDKTLLNTLLWSYTGTKNFTKEPELAYASVINYVTPGFPPTFISAGNADPLESQSHAFANKLATRKIYVDSLFFAKTYTPALPHEYQFNFDVPAGNLSFERMVRFLEYILHNK